MSVDLLAIIVVLLLDLIAFEGFFTKLVVALSVIGLGIIGIQAMIL